MIPAIKTAMMLEETMTTMKRLHGEKWNEAAEPYRKVLRDVLAKNQSTNVLGAALQIGKAMSREGLNPAMLLAVAADMVYTENPDVSGSRTARQKGSES